MLTGQRISSNGVDLFTVSDGAGIPVVLVHGGPGLGHYYLTPAIQALADEFKAISYDQRGTGQSTPFSSQDISLDDHLKDLESLRLALGLKRMNLLGHSFGAVFALLYAAQHPSRMASLILAHPGPPFALDMLRTLEATFTERRTAESRALLARLRASDGYRARDPRTLEDYIKALYSPFFVHPASLEVMMLGFTETTARQVIEAEEAMIPQVLALNPERLLGQIPCPTLVISAEGDLIPQEFPELLAKQILRSELKVLSGVGHFSFLETPSTFLNVVLPFLREHAR